MNDQVRAVVFILLALLILFTWGHFFKPPVPAPQPATTGNAQVAPSAGAGTSGAASIPGSVAVASGPTAAAGKSSPVTAIQAAEEKTIVVESPLYRVEFSNRGGVVRSWKLKKYLTDQKPPRPLDLVNGEAAKELGWPFSLVLTDSQLEAQANSALYDVTPTAASNANANLQAPTDVTFHWSDGHLDVVKKLSFTLGYEMTVECTVTVDGKAIPAAIAWRGGFGDKEVYNAAQLVSVFYKQNDKLNLLQYKKLGVSGNQAQPAVQNGPLEYLGIEDQFFTAAFLPDGTNLSLWHWMQNHNVLDDGKTVAEPEAEMAAGTTEPAELRARVFVGPKDLTLLSSVKPPLKELVQFGWTEIIAKPIFDILKWIYKYVPNYGWAIVILTLIINMAIFPLKMKSWRSMQKMQKVAPEVRQIQDRYKKYSMSDPRKKKMNEEVMAVYSREGINPMGSCIPMLFQMPIWWALWRVLNGAIELRHAPWIWWLHDLSAKDPYYILPIAMTITMYLTTKMTPQTTADPSQQKMMQFMPLFMGVIFFRLSSGLNLYMFTSNLVGMGQQYYLNRTEPLPSRSKFKKKNE
ncbi:MAG: membrane protein insertase YidC [Candidatus Acidiferrales bacterium]